MQAITFVMLLTAAICALIHAVLPFLFESTSSRIILKLHGKMAARKLFEALITPPMAEFLTIGRVRKSADWLDFMRLAGMYRRDRLKEPDPCMPIVATPVPT